MDQAFPDRDAAQHDLTDTVARFLETNAGGGLCHTCLASLFSISFDKARTVIGQLRFRPDFRTESARCSVCRKLKMTIRTFAR